MIVAFVYNSNNVNFENYADDGQTIIPVNAPFSNLYIYIFGYKKLLCFDGFLS